jgi:hypothetical protein
VPFLDSASDQDLGQLVRAAVRLVRREGGFEEDDPAGDVEIRITLRRPPER